MYKQIIIARKDLGMSPGKLAAQVSHGSIAFLSQIIKDNIDPEPDGYYTGTYYYEGYFDKDLYEQWLDGKHTKCVLQARNKSQLLKAKTLAEELDFVEGRDFFLIYDNCHTELTPEENGKTLTCIGFKPMDSEVIDSIGRKYHLYM